MFTNANPFAGYELSEHLRECIEPYLEGTTSGMPGRSCSHAGETAWDDCECGQLLVSWTGAWESATFPEPWTGTDNAGGRKCGPPLFVYQFTIEMLRCSPSGGENGEPPSCEAVSAAARVTNEDAWAVRAGVMCCLCAGVAPDPVTRQKEFERYWVGPQLPAGPEGGCQGSQLTVQIGVKNGGYPCGVS